MTYDYIGYFIVKVSSFHVNVSRNADEVYTHAPKPFRQHHFDDVIGM